MRAPLIALALFSSIPALAATNVQVLVDGQAIRLPQSGDTVRVALADAKITLGADDEVTPSLEQRLGSDAIIRVSRVSFTEASVDVKIPYRTLVRPATRSLRPYHPTVTREGRPGLKRVSYRVKQVDGREEERKTVKEETVREPVDEIVTSRQPLSLGSRGAYTGKKTLLVLTSAYDPGPGSCGAYADGRTCNGKRAGYGIIAVDPKVIPLGKKLLVPGYGYGIAADVGGAIKGNRLDLGFNSRSGAMLWGKRWVRVTILD